MIHKIVGPENQHKSDENGHFQVLCGLDTSKYPIADNDGWVVLSSNWVLDPLRGREVNCQKCLKFKGLDEVRDEHT